MEHGSGVSKVTGASRLTWLLIAFALGLPSCAGPSALVRRESPGEQARRQRPGADISPAAAARPAVPRPPEFDAASWYQSHGEDPFYHGVYVESLTPGRVLASHNADKPFNPASLVKLATTLAALRRLGPDYRFKIHAYASGEVEGDGTLRGDLYFIGSAPTFGDEGANALANELKGLGVRRVAGSVKVSPDFCFNFSGSPHVSAERLVKALRLEGRPAAVGVAGLPEGKPVFVYESAPLRGMLLYMNARSVNFVSERVANRLGGPLGVEQFLEQELKIAPWEVMLSTASGLEHNEMTPRAVVRVIRALVAEAARHGLEPSDILPVAGADAGTLRRRFQGTPLEGAVLGKTGTLTSTDGGMSSLGGLVYTAGSEPLVFVILDQSTEVWKYREMQERLLADILRDRVTPETVAVAGPRELLREESLRVERRGTLAGAPAEVQDEPAAAE